MKWKTQRVGEEEVLVSEEMGPAVLGLIRPRIVLPVWALELGQEKLEMILLHEREHQRARDPALLTLGLLLAAITPWNPGLWWMTRRLHLAVEGDCDGRVLARGVPPKSYGSLLLEVASGARGLSALAPALAEGGLTFLERRLLMIRSTVRKHRFGVAALAALASGGLLALACETPTPPTPMEAEITLEAPPVVMEVANSGLAEIEEGYFLIRQTGEGVEYIGSVSPEKVKLLREDGEVALTGDLIKVGESKGVRVRLKEEVAGKLNADGPKPLIIVDGVIMSDPDAIADLPPDEIESIEVIKGGAAEALYGERAAGGVILVTTKR
jgi:TonB-dependent SusC/RagA subfamily outer membrane receptor